MKISVTIGSEHTDMMFDRIEIKTKERSFAFAHATIGTSLSEVYRYYSASDIEEINFWRYKL